jgi:hypothetical protein
MQSQPDKSMLNHPPEEVLAAVPIHEAVDVYDVAACRQSTGWVVDRQAEMISVVVERDDMPGMDGPIVLQLRAAPDRVDLGTALVEHAELMPDGRCMVRIRCRGLGVNVETGTDAS